MHYLGLMFTWSQFEISFSYQNFKGATGASFIFLSISFCWNLFEDLTRKIEQKNQLEKNVKAAELNFLESQINPHFLFNVLGCINGLALIGSKETAKAVENLKELIRGASSMKTGERIPLFKELRFIESFIHLHQLRYAVPIEIDFPDVSSSKFEIEPMLLLPIVENVFKHGDVTETGLIKIACTIDQKNFMFSIENKINEDIAVQNDGGIGDQNVRQRLKLAYKNKAIYQSEKVEKEYKTQLKIRIY